MMRSATIRSSPSASVIGLMTRPSRGASPCETQTIGSPVSSASITSKARHAQQFVVDPDLGLRDAAGRAGQVAADAAQAVQRLGQPVDAGRLGRQLGRLVVREVPLQRDQQPDRLLLADLARPADAVVRRPGQSAGLAGASRPARQICG